MGDSFNEHIKEFGEKDTSIDRINVSGNYCKDNCKWPVNKAVETPIRKRSN